MVSVLEAIINILFPIGYFMWRIFAFFFSLIGRVIKDILGNVYTRLIAIAGAGILAYLAYLATQVK